MQKPFSVGARIEHPREMINRSQYGKFAGHPALGAADYKLACHPPHGRGAYTFCMCPGGTVVAAASENGGVVVDVRTDQAVAEQGHVMPSGREAEFVSAVPAEACDIG